MDLTYRSSALHRLLRNILEDSLRRSSTESRESNVREDIVRASPTIMARIASQRCLVLEFVSSQYQGMIRRAVGKDSNTPQSPTSNVISTELSAARQFELTLKSLGDSLNVGDDTAFRALSRHAASYSSFISAELDFLRALEARMKCWQDAGSAELTPLLRNGRNSVPTHNPLLFTRAPALKRYDSGYDPERSGDSQVAVDVAWQLYNTNSTPMRRKSELIPEEVSDDVKRETVGGELASFIGKDDLAVV